MVLADGTFVTASKDQHADLFWALRGGGGNFGVVTSFLFQAHPVSTVYAGPIFWEAKHAQAVMRAYRDFLPTAPEELGIFVGLKTVPPTDPFPARFLEQARMRAHFELQRSRRSKASRSWRSSSRRSRRRSSTGWARYRSRRCRACSIHSFRRVCSGTGRVTTSSRSTDEAIDTHIAQAAKAPSDFCLMHLYPIEGAVRRVAKDATAWSARDATWSMVIAAIDPNPKQADALKTWGRGYWKAVHPFNLEGAYVNFMMDDEADGRVQATYGPNYSKLAAVKKKYDPKNLFRVNQNIRPAA